MISWEHLGGDRQVEGQMDRSLRLLVGPRFPLPLLERLDQPLVAVLLLKQPFPLDLASEVRQLLHREQAAAAPHQSLQPPLQCAALFG